MECEEGTTTLSGAVLPLKVIMHRGYGKEVRKDLKYPSRLGILEKALTSTLIEEKRKNSIPRGHDSSLRTDGWTIRRHSASNLREIKGASYRDRLGKLARRENGSASTLSKRTSRAKKGSVFSLAQEGRTSKRA